MRKLTQKELVHEGIGSFLKNVVKGTAAGAANVAKGIAKVASPTGYDAISKAGKFIKGVDQAVQGATTSDDKKIVKYFQDQELTVKNITPGMTKGTKVVQLSGIKYNSEGKASEEVYDTPAVVKIEGNNVKVVKSPVKIGKK